MKTTSKKKAPADRGLLVSKNASLCLQRFDPFLDNPIVALVDPALSQHRSPKAPVLWTRIAAATFLALFPQALFSILPSTTLGGGFWGSDGTYRDTVYWLMWLIVPGYLGLIVVGRRAIGSMINQLEEGFDVKVPVGHTLNGVRALPGWLRVIEWCTRLDRRRMWGWLVLFFFYDAFFYSAMLSDGAKNWLTSPATTGTFFHILSVNGAQPNLAGLYYMLVCGVFSAIEIFLVFRLIVVFVIVCRQLPIVLEDFVAPSHPDTVGGLLVVGKTSLLFSLPILLVGLNLTSLTLTDLFIWRKTPDWPVFVGWGLYGLLGPALFFLPLIPLRRMMRSAKTSYYASVHRLFVSNEQALKSSFKTGMRDESLLEQQKTLGQLLKEVAGMSVWPFDRNTFLRFVGIIISPMLPIVSTNADAIVKSLLKYLGLL